MAEGDRAIGALSKTHRLAGFGHSPSVKLRSFPGKQIGDQALSEFQFLDRAIAEKFDRV